MPGASSPSATDTRARAGEVGHGGVLYLQPVPLLPTEAQVSPAFSCLQRRPASPPAKRPAALTGSGPSRSFPRIPDAGSGLLGRSQGSPKTCAKPKATLDTYSHVMPDLQDEVAKHFDCARAVATGSQMATDWGSGGAAVHAECGLGAAKGLPIGGGGGIRTHERLAPLPVFKTGAMNRSATPPRAASVASARCGRQHLD